MPAPGSNRPVRKLPLVLLGAAVVPLAAILGAWRLDAFLHSEAPFPMRFVEPADNLRQSLVHTAGYVRFSRAGFSDDFTQALVVVERVVRDGFGEGTYYLLEQRGRGWQVGRPRQHVDHLSRLRCAS